MGFLATEEGTEDAGLAMGEERVKSTLGGETLLK